MVAVAELSLAEDYGALKRSLLLFDHLVIPSFRAFPEPLSWLNDNGIVLNAFETLASDDGAIVSLRDFYIEDFLSEMAPAQSALEAVAFGPSFLLRGMAAVLRKELGWDAVSFAWNEASGTRILPTGQNRVLEIAFHAMPEPDELTPWELILEWRNDPESAAMYRRLRRWLRNIATGYLPVIDLEEEIEYLVDEYRAHMKLHHMKASHGIARSLLVTSAEIAGNLASFKWGKAAGALFSTRDRRIALLEAELNAPGRDIAYIVEARSQFL